MPPAPQLSPGNKAREERDRPPAVPGVLIASIKPGQQSPGRADLVADLDRTVVASIKPGQQSPGRGPFVRNIPYYHGSLQLSPGNKAREEGLVRAGLEGASCLLQLSPGNKAREENVDLLNPVRGCRASIKPGQQSPGRGRSAWAEHRRPSSFN